ncbi:MAG: ROK family protein [Actinobacteria bacterium]|jgi:polyphosphate glucokinase|nr:ROK family protein [Actinomycetota bacterium]MCL6105630.1 ROK family protein [Actinomycetota bacterium]
MVKNIYKNGELGEAAKLDEHFETKRHPFTLAVDIGGTGLKAAVLDISGAMVTDRVRIPTTYPCSPHKLIADLCELVSPLGEFDRVSVGFPGVVREGRVITAPHFSTEHGPGTPKDNKLVAAWSGFKLADKLAKEFGKPTRVANDADLQGSAVVEGKGVELVLTLGTGVGTGLFANGKLAPHLELAHHPFHKGETYNEQLGEVALQAVGVKSWNKRVAKAIELLNILLNYDHLYIGGGNAKKLTLDLPSNVSTVDNLAGILGGIKLWELDSF